MCPPEVGKGRRELYLCSVPLYIRGKEERDTTEEAKDVRKKKRKRKSGELLVLTSSKKRRTDWKCKRN